MSTEIFICYADRDERLLKELEVYLKPLQRDGLITVWHDREIPPGKDWADEIDVKLNAADVILLLISVRFLYSDYCYKKEMARALERHEAKEAIVIPVILGPCGWKEAPFSKLQVLPTDGRPVKTWPNRDVAWDNVIQGIKKVIEDTQDATVPNELLLQDQDARESSIADLEEQKYLAFCQQQRAFDQALSRVLPGKRGYIQAETQEMRHKILSSLADASEACELWWFAGNQSCPGAMRDDHAYPMRHIAEDLWLLQGMECLITDVWVYRGTAIDRQYVIVHIAPLSPTGLDYADNLLEEVGYYKGRYINWTEYDDGYTEIDGNIVELDDSVEVRYRYLQEDFFFLVPHFSIHHQDKTDLITAQVYQSLCAAKKIHGSLLLPIEKLKRPDWVLRYE